MSNKEIGYISTLYQCIECGKQEIVKAGDHKIDGRACKYCKGHLSPVGYIGFDLGRDTPGRKN